MLVKEPLPRFILLGDQGSFIKYGMDVHEEALKRGLKPTAISNWGIEPEAIHGRLNTEFKGIHFTGTVESEPGDYGKFYQNVYDVITGKGELYVKPQEARNTIRIIELALQSQSEKRTVPYSDT